LNVSLLEKDIPTIKKLILAELPKAIDMRVIKGGEDAGIGIFAAEYVE
jgi:hypothetical protein